MGEGGGGDSEGGGGGNFFSFFIIPERILSIIGGQKYIFLTSN